MEFIGLIVFLILVYWRPQDAIASLENVRLVLPVMAVTSFLWIAKRSQGGNKYPIAVFPLDYAMLGFFIAIVISTYNYHWLRYTFDMFIEFAKIMIFYFLIADCVNTKSRMDRILGVLSVLTMLIAGIAVLQRFGIDIFNAGMRLGDRVQGIGIYGNPNYLAYSIAMIIPIQYFLFRKVKYLPFKILNLVPLFISYLCIFYTKSRGGLLCVLGTTVFMFAQRKRPIVKYVVLFLGILMLVGLLSFGPRFGTLGKGDDTIQARIEAWYSGLNMLKDHPVIGVGVHLFNEYHKGKTAHSSFVLAGSEEGLFGLFMWIAIIYFSIRLLRTRTMQDEYKQYAMALEASIVSYIIISFSASFTYRITFFILCGLISALVRIDLQHRVDKITDKDQMRAIVNERIRYSRHDFMSIATIMIFTVLIWHLIIKHRY